MSARRFKTKEERDEYRQRSWPISRTPLEQIRSLVTDVLEGRRQYVDTYGDEAATLLARDIETILKDYGRS